MSATKLAVIGAGWAGCVAALELADAGYEVDLYEASRQLGGRARSLAWQDLTLDNGQHILLGAYSACLKFIARLGISEQQAFLRLPLQMVYAPGDDGMDFQAPRLPAPLHTLLALIRASGLSWSDKLALMRFSSAAQWMGWTLYEDCSVSDLLARFEQTERLCKLMWYPLCIAALNTAPELASAKVFLAVLRDSLGAHRAASDMLLPKLNLSALLPEACAQALQQARAGIRSGQAVTQLSQHANGDWQVHTANSSDRYRAIVLATQAYQAQRLLRQATLADNSATQAEALARLIPDYDYEVITTCYLRYPATVTLPRAFYALCDQLEQKKYGQFVFDRGQLDPAQAGVLAVVISAAAASLELAAEELSLALARQLSQSLGQPVLAEPLDYKVISEKRATFSCRPGLTRPAQASGITGLYLAGDYTASDYPATLEAAVRSGVAAAAALRQQLTQT